ncbi:MAG: UTP--glucose-1-phosphate uridylyltransferase [Planctomycetota bacterium]|jgi:UDP-N-acetylglucosamine/UDP-N-acetylgalactosamine diphosphorylase
MTAKKEVHEIEETLRINGQSHLLRFWGDLDSTQKQELADQIKSLHWPEINDWVANYVQNAPSLGIPDEILPPEFYPAVPTNSSNQAKYAEAVELGTKLLSAGKVAAFVVAGGQGTRLGLPGPKGDLPVSPVKNKTLFRIFAETIAAASNRYETTIPWYIMTSPLNHSETTEIFQKNEYFGLGSDNVRLFQQGTLPNFDFDGRILLAEKGKIATSPDGHGGSLKALYGSGAFEDMTRRGVEYISYWQVDNPLINIFDPLFIGLHALDGSEMSSKTVIKTGPFEKVGNFCIGDGKLTVIEYSDLPDELAKKKNKDGSLAFQLGSIAIHIISRSFVEKLNAKGFSLPIHRAVKKIPHIDSHGSRVEPEEPNGIKLETFVFDALPPASNSIILETIRSEEFAPTKNAIGIDSIETTKQMMVDRAADWLESAGVEIPRKVDGSPDCTLEIAPSFALCREDVAEKRDQIPEIKPGDTVYLA